MDDGSRIDALTYLDRFFDAVRDEARSNPAFSARLVEALGGEIVFPGEDKLALLNPLKLAAVGEDQLRNAITGLTPKDLKSVLKANNLATPVDMRGLSVDDLGEMLVARALNRLNERTNSSN